jgi:hypothetical protein
MHITEKWNPLSILLFLALMTSPTTTRLLSRLDEILTIFIRYVAPPTIAVVVGGVLANRYFPRWQTQIALERSRIERTNEISEEIMAAFSGYISSWRRLISLAEYQRLTLEPVSTDLENRILENAKERNEKRDALEAVLRKFLIYANEEQRTSITRFLDWDEGLSIKRLEQLPELAEWRRWEKEICGNMRFSSR